MTDFGTVILAHLVGDYLLQNDWLAKYKTESSFRGFVACVLHCAIYTATLLVLTQGVYHYGVYLMVFGAHCLVDHLSLARKWMLNVSGQRDFVHNMSPWSVIVVDNTIHLLTSWFAIMWHHGNVA